MINIYIYYFIIMSDYQSLCTYWRDFNSDRPIIKSDDMTLKEELDFI